MYPSDWFLVNGTDLGRVLTVELPPRGAPAESVALTLDADVEPGDVLDGHDPVAA